MATIGEILKKAREERNLTLQQAAYETRVRPHYLRALEEDERDVLPSAVQGRGYLRLYADYLGLNVQRLLDAWESNQVLEEVPHSVAAPVVAPAELDAEPVEAVEAVEARRVISTPPIETLAPEQPETPSQAVFVEIGQRLRSQREALAITLADAEKYTRVRQHYLHALENGRLDQLPSTVQARGMLNNYAHFLNLDASALLDRFADGLQARREERLETAVDVRPRKAASAASPSEPQGQKPVKSAVLRRFLTPDLVIGGGLLVLMVFFFIWGANRLNLTGPAVIGSATAPSIAEILMVSPTSGAQPSTAEATQPAAEQTVQPAAATQLPLEQTPSAVVGTQVNTDPLQVYVIARQRAWVRVTVDGKVAFQGRTIPGNAYAYSGSQRIELLTGNAGGLQVLFNQNDMGSLGAVGQVASLDFTLSGVVTPTPSSSPSPTAAPLPTLTPAPTILLPTPTVTPFIP